MLLLGGLGLGGLEVLADTLAIVALAGDLGGKLAGRVVGGSDLGTADALSVATGIGHADGSGMGSTFHSSGSELAVVTAASANASEDAVNA